MANEELWKPITGYEGLYEVSDFGRVRTVEHFEKAGDRIRIRRSRIKKEIVRGRYLAVELSKNGVNTKYSLHRLVAENFLENPNGLPIVNHKDQNPHNNRADNLEWCTTKYNVHYADADKKRRESMDWYYKSEKCKNNMRIVGQTDWRQINGNNSN